MALNESIADARNTLKLSCECVKTLQHEMTQTRPDERGPVREEPRRQPTMEVALPTPVRVGAPRAASPERKKSRKRFNYKKVQPFDSNKIEWRDFLDVFEMAAR